MEWFKNKTIVVPVDFSEDSLNAVKVARQQLADEERDLHIIHVLPELPAATYPGLTANPLDDDARKREATGEIRKAISEFASDDICLEIRVGDAGHEIVEFAKEISADLIVMPSHGRSGISRVLLGSVAERVTRHAPCPVLILRTSAR